MSSNHAARKKIAILFGGCSEEHDISVKSAREIAANINTERYEPIFIFITRSGEWRLCDAPDLTGTDSDRPLVFITPLPQVRGLVMADPQSGRYQLMKIDAVFPVLHGKMGEDGTIQGLLELSGIPYVGCDVQSSVLCMDKSLAHTVARKAGIPTPDFWILAAEQEPVPDGITYPAFVKPARSGSSFGITKVTQAAELAAAIRLARQYDDKVIIEQAITGSEVGCAVLGTGDSLTVGEVDLIQLSHGFFRIHQENAPESGSENARITVPAPVTAPVRLKIQQTARAVYRALGCRGLARVDLFLQDDGQIVLNEVNTLPGFTSYSRYPRMMAAAGIPLTILIERLIEMALEDKR